MSYDQPHPPSYVMLNGDQGNRKPPPKRRHVPRYNESGKSRGNCCLKCLCCCCCFLFLVILSCAITFYVLYTMYQPQIPRYNIDQIKVKDFTMQQDLTLEAEFAVTVKANNPNNYIGFIYGKNSFVSVSYHQRQLSEGKLPSFHQPNANVSVIPIVLKGKSDFDSEMQDAFTKDKESGKIPLLVQVQAPIVVTIGQQIGQQVLLREVTVFVNCSLNVNSLQPNDTPQILSTKYSYNMKF
ncbi:hypothetical protein ACFE04_018994 [Oxalis oulophora]